MLYFGPLNVIQRHLKYCSVLIFVRSLNLSKVLSNNFPFFFWYSTRYGRCIFFISRNILISFGFYWIQIEILHGRGINEKLNGFFLIGFAIRANIQTRHQRDYFTASRCEFNRIVNIFVTRPGAYAVVFMFFFKNQE